MTIGLNHGYGGVKVNKKLNVKGFCTDLAYDLVGSVLYAAGIVCFVNPANMAPGGMSGVAILLNYLWGLPIGTMTIVLNILYLKVFRWNIYGYVASIICSDALSTVCLFMIARLWKYFRLRRINFYLWRSMLLYALPLVPDAILVYIIGFSDQAFLASMQNTSVSAIYSIAYRVPTLIAQIRKRGRDYEINIDEDYLCRLNAKYEHWVNDIYDGEVLVIDKDTEDFVENPAVLETICRRIDGLRNERSR